MKLNLNKNTIKKFFLILGVTFILSRCSLNTDSREENYTQENQDYSYDQDNHIDDEALDEEQDDDIEDEEEEKLIDEDEEEKQIEEPKQEEMDKEIIKINDVDELDEYFSEEIDFQDVREAALNNSNLSSEDQDYILELVDDLEEKTPNIHLRCLYENVKRLTIEQTENPYTNSNIAAEFIPEKYQINIYPDAQETSVYHELIHAIYELYLEQDDVVLKRSLATEDTRFISEGFTEWFRSFLFNNDEEIAYYPEFHDINTLIFILHTSKERFIERLTNHNATYLIENLKEYLNEKEISSWISINDKEIDSLISKENELITKDEMMTKYTTLLKFCINSKQTIDARQKYQIMELLFNSYCYYSEVYGEQIEKLTDQIEKELMKYLDYTNNSIEIRNSSNRHIINYCDVNQVYLIKNKNGFFIAEQYRDIEEEIKYFAKIPYVANEDDQIVPIQYLIDYEGEKYDIYTDKDFIEIYLEYSKDELDNQPKVKIR